MISIDVIAVGKLSADYFKDGCKEYAKRISRFAKIKLVEINEEKLPENPSRKQIESALLKEGERISSKIGSGDYVIAMCIEGKEFSSGEIADKIENIEGSHSKVDFIIGSSYGLSDSIKDLSDFKLSLGKITLPHQLARLVLLEQIYRAFSIISNMKYNK